MSLHKACKPDAASGRHPGLEKSTVKTIGFLGFGEVATHLAAELQRHGASIAAFDLLLGQRGGTDRLKLRAGSMPVDFLSLSDLVARAAIVLSTVTTQAALDVAKDCAAHLNKGHVYVDLNATSPEVKRSIAEVLAPSGAEFVEGAILGAVGVTKAQTRILVCGAKGAQVAEVLTGLGLNVGFYGAEIGRASTFKLLRSVFSKGMEALLLESLVAARRAGLGEDVWREIVETLDERPFVEVGGNWMRTHGSAHARRYYEMVQVEALLRELGIEPLLTGATTAFFERSTRLSLSSALPSGPKDAEAVLAALDKLLRENPSSESPRDA
jgi:3-hydroxyisobutyrate dehydrogenase-like beta-hydroxyacid dehydrogenase